MTKLDDDNNTVYSFFKMTQIILDLKIRYLILLTALMPYSVIVGGPIMRLTRSQSAMFYPSLSFVLLLYSQLLIPLFLICGVADVKMMTGVVSLPSTGSALPSKHFLFLEEVALPEATINIIIAGKSGLIISVAKPLNEAVSLEGFIISFFFINPLLACHPCRAGPSVISEHLEQSRKLYIRPGWSDCSSLCSCVTKSIWKHFDFNLRRMISEHKFNHYLVLTPKWHTPNTMC